MSTTQIRIEDDSLEKLEPMIEIEERKTGLKINKTNMVNKAVKFFINSHNDCEAEPVLCTKCFNANCAGDC